MIRTVLSCALALGLSSSAWASEAVSPWARDEGSALRLVDAGPAEAPGTRLAAIAIRLEPGWKTYWRQPGASGVPPRFDFTGSANLAEARVVYPVPERSVGEDGVTNVYHGLVTLPVAVRPRDPGAPVELRLVADYGVCERVCVPVRAEARLRLAPSGGGEGPEAEEVRAAVASTPRPSRLGASEAPSIASVTRSAGAAGVQLDVVATVPPGDDEPALFAETGEGDYAPAPELAGPPRDGRALFRLRFDEPELPPSGLKLTLSAGGASVETPVALDAIGRAP